MLPEPLISLDTSVVLLSQIKCHLLVLRRWLILEVMFLPPRLLSGAQKYKLEQTRLRLLEAECMRQTQAAPYTARP